MGKKKSGNGGGGVEKGWEEETVVAREFVLKVAMHCRCNGCKGKVRAALRNITLDPGVEAADSSAAESSGEVRLLATADPERLRRRLHKATGKNVDLLLPKEPASKKQENADAATLDALLAQLQLQAPGPSRQQYGGQGAAPWANHQLQQQLMGLGLGGGAWNGGAGGYGEEYPWLSSSCYYPGTPGTGYGAYGYAPPAPAPVHGNVGHYGGAPAWLGY